MGAPSKAFVEAATDRIAALAAADLAGFAGELGTATQPSMWGQLDALADPAVVAALVSSSQLIDDQSLPENLATPLNLLANRPGFKAWFLALKSLVTSAAGGAYASLNAYLTATGAKLHPLAAELGRVPLGATGIQAASVFCPSYAALAPTRVYTGQDGTLADDTVDATDVGTADVALFAAQGDVLYVGSTRKFSQLVAGLSTLSSATCTLSVQYWNGNAWSAVSGLTDSSAGLTRNDRIKWTEPSDWVRSNQDAGGDDLADLTPLYYLRIERTAVTVVTPPVATSIRIIPALAYLSGTSHLGIAQPPLAIVRITAANTVAVEQLCSPDLGRFAAPGLVLRALTPFGVDVTPTVSYTDQDANNATQAQSALTTPAALSTSDVTLAGGDTGIQTVRETGWAATTTATSGIFVVEVAELRTPAL